MIRLVQKFRNNRDGAVTIEGAFVLPLMILIGLGGLDASFLMLQNHRLESRLTAAASYLSKSDAPALKETAAKNIAISGNIDGTGDGFVKNWSADDITISYVTTDNSDGGFRGGDTVLTIELNTAIDYSGFGILKSIKPVKLKAAVQERIVGGGV